jgi:hypothetical protein
MIPNVIDTNVIVHGLTAYVFWWVVGTAVVIFYKKIVRGDKEYSFRGSIGIGFWVALAMGMRAAADAADGAPDTIPGVPRALAFFFIGWLVITLGVRVIRLSRGGDASLEDTLKTSFPFAAIVGLVGLLIVHA